MLCRYFKFVCCQLCQKKAIRERDSRVGSGRTGSAWFVTDIEKAVKNKIFFVLCPMHQRSIVHETSCCWESRIGLWKEALDCELAPLCSSSLRIAGNDCGGRNKLTLHMVGVFITL